jgi:hypothetical protein
VNTIETETARENEPDIRVDANPRLALLGVLVRTVARVWVMGLLLLAAAFSGVAVYQLFERQAELRELRKGPGPEAYAVVAYRRELERQVQALERGWREDVVPTPPPRPRLLEEIDLARHREQDRVVVSRELAPISAPP